MLSMEITGLAELQAKLRAMPEAVQNTLEAGAVDQGAEIIAAAVRDKCPTKSGKLKATIRVSAARKVGNKVRAQVQAGDKDVYYALMVEVGHFAGSRRRGADRTFVPAHPYMRPGFDEKVGEATRRIGEAVAAGVTNYWANATP